LVAILGIASPAAAGISNLEVRTPRLALGAVTLEDVTVTIAGARSCVEAASKNTV
jgi:hypothetical protein